MEGHNYNSSYMHPSCTANGTFAHNYVFSLMALNIMMEKSGSLATTLILGISIS